MFLDQKWSSQHSATTEKKQNIWDSPNFKAYSED